MNNLEIGFLVYLGVYRLALVAVSGTSIVLGYLLFKTAFVNGGTGTSVSGQAGGVRLTMRNAAPGTCFALFGALLAAGTAIWMPPSIETYEKLGQGEAKRFRAKGGGEPGTSEPGNESSASLQGTRRFDALKREGDEHLRTSKFPDALKSYRAALAEPSISRQQVSEVLDEVAWVGQEQGVLPLREAEVLASVAIGLGFGNPSPLHTLAKIALKRGQSKDALALAERALQISPDQPEFIATAADARAAVQGTQPGAAR